MLDKLYAIIAGIAAGFMLTVLAVFILAILIAHLIPQHPYGPEDPVSSIRYGLRNIVSSGYGTTTPQKFRLPKDVYIDAQSIIGDLPVKPGEIAFECQNSPLCGLPNSALTVQEGGTQSTTASITVNQNTLAFAVVCGNDNRKVNPKYCVGIGSTGADARTACTQKCFGN